MFSDQRDKRDSGPFKNYRDGTNGIRDDFKIIGTGQTGFGTIKNYRDGTNGIRDTRKFVPQISNEITRYFFTVDISLYKPEYKTSI